MTGQQTLHMVGNAHLDAVWIWPWEEGCAEVRATFRSALDRMDEDPDFLFACDSMAYYAWVEEHDPELFQRMRQRILEGRWEPTGGWWVEPDCNIPGGEALVRQGLYGQLYLRSRFGRTATVGMNVDPFGHAGSLPQILVQQGLSAYVFFRPLAAEKELPGPVFRWRSPDGAEILACRIPHEYSSGMEIDDLGPHTMDVIEAIPGAWTEAMCFYGVGNHGGGPTRANIASIHRLAAAPGGPRIVFSTPSRFFGRVRATSRPETIPVIEGELQHHAVGCYSAHSAVKALNSRAEQALTTAELWSTVAARRFGNPYPLADLGHAWRQLGFNQFHDLVAGTAIESAYVTSRDQVGETLAIAGRALNRSLQTIARQIHIEQVEGTSPLIVFNPLAWPVETPVEVEFGAFHGPAALIDADGRHIRVQAAQSEATMARRRRLVFTVELPALGYRLYRVQPATEDSKGNGAPAAAPFGVTVAGTPDRGYTIDNGRLRVVVDARTGWISEVVELATGTAVRTTEGARHAEVLNDPSDTWGHGVEAFDQACGSFVVTSVKVIEEGPVRVVVRVESAFGTSRLREDFALTDHSPYVEVDVFLDWHERHWVLKVRVPTAIEDVVATYEIPYGAIERPPTGHEEPGQSWVDVTGTVPGGARAGISVFTTGKYAYDIRGGNIGITAARGAVFACHDPADLQAGQEYAYQDQGRQRFRYAVMPHAGTWQEARTAYHARVFNRPPITLLDSAHPGALPPSGSFADTGSFSVELAALKVSEDGLGDVVARFVELHGREAAASADLALADRTLTVTLAPHEIRSFRVPTDPARPVVEVDLLEDPVAGTVAAAGSAVDAPGV